jgi:hypothetical protein
VDFWFELTQPRMELRNCYITFKVVFILLCFGLFYFNSMDNAMDYYSGEFVTANSNTSGFKSFNQYYTLSQYLDNNIKASNIFMEPILSLKSIYVYSRYWGIVLYIQLGSGHVLTYKLVSYTLVLVEWVTYTICATNIATKPNLSWPALQRPAASMAQTHRLTELGYFLTFRARWCFSQLKSESLEWFSSLW